MKATLHGQGFYHSQGFYYDKCLIDSDDDWSKFEITLFGKT